MQIGILGLGNWGTALAEHLARKGFDVLGWSIDESIVNSVNSVHRNNLCFPHLILSEGLRATSKLDDVLCCPVLVLAFASSALATVIPQIRTAGEPLIVSAIKGLEQATLMTVLQYAEHNLPNSARLAAISGPSFAKDVVRGQPCGVVAAAKEQRIAEEAATLFASDTMRVYTSLDPVGVEIGAVVKNVLAIAAGICDGMGLGDSARAVLITRGLAEMMRLAKALCADAQTLSGLSGLGDLIMTASCDASRNRTVGLRLGRGEKLEHILQTLGSVAEGVGAAEAVLKLAALHGVELPISYQVGRILRAEVKPEEVIGAFFARPLRREFD